MAEVKLVKLELVKGKDYTVFGIVFTAGQVVEVTPEQAKYLLGCDGHFAEPKTQTTEVKDEVKPEV